MDRRSWLKTAGSTALGLAATVACGRADPWERFAGAPEPRRRLARVLVSPARVIRTVAGLRPFRPSGFVVRALDYGGLVFEDDKPRTLAEAMAALEIGLRQWFKEQGIKLVHPPTPE